MGAGGFQSRPNSRETPNGIIPRMVNGPRMGAFGGRAARAIRRILAVQNFGELLHELSVFMYRRRCALRCLFQKRGISDEGDNIESEDGRAVA